MMGDWGMAHPYLAFLITMYTIYALCNTLIIIIKLMYCPKENEIKEDKTDEDDLEWVNKNGEYV